MNANRASLEVIAPSVEEAIAKGLAELGLAEDAVEVEVLDSGSRGLFGLGLRQARVRLTIREQPKTVIDRPAEPPLAEKPEPVMPEAAAPRAESAAAAFNSPERQAAPEKQAAPERQALPEKQAVPERTGAPRVETVEDEMLLRVARETVEELLMKMKVRARVTSAISRPDDEQDRAPVWVDVRGDDLSILIGPKAETLNALQYITSLIVGKEIGHSVPLVVDVEGYRARRSQQIRQLARRMAEQAIRTGRRQSLEPMPASERRLVHIELRDHPEVTTESVGDEPRRKVTIVPK